jgi:hypothetical protein
MRSPEFRNIILELTYKITTIFLAVIFFDTNETWCWTQTVPIRGVHAVITDDY